MTDRTADRTQFLSGLLSCAIEGGIKHWADVDQYHWKGLETTTGARATIYETVNDRSDPRTVILDQQSSWGTFDHYAIPHEINVDVIARGINLIASGEISYGNSSYFADRRSDRTGSHARLRRQNSTNGTDCDLGDYDAWDADAIVQAGLFSELRYT